MPSEKGDMQAVTIWIKKDLVDKIDKLAEKADITRSKLITNLVDVGVEEAEFMNKFGIWAAAKVFEDIRQRLKSNRAKKQKEREKVKD
jgi:metal-responsive CopG/Arc/MetJ family transcriptional regulator